MRNNLKRYGKWALVTGASAGIGLEFAKQLASQGVNLVLVARRGDLLTAHAEEFTRKFNINVLPLARDLTGDNAVEALFEELAKTEIGLVVMNAGVEATGHFTKIPLEDHTLQTRLNIDVPMRMARLFGENMVERGCGGLIFVSSLFGYQGVPLVANYAASKAYILALGEALNVEMKPSGVDVLVLSPGLTDTDMPAQMPVDFNKMPITISSPEVVVRKALRALGRKPTIVPGFINKFYAWENRLIPRSWPVKLFGSLMKNAMDKKSRSALLHAKSRP
ncbi:MAG: SDR family NAD(P)-dependent oxidoreductase [Proteobacteria bacterium]|nr:SDR family NAD(P)-dependent oxidoreductase [Pseudomonadota bacterium]